jgi:YHS domain-containing protein
MQLAKVTIPVACVATMMLTGLSMSAPNEVKADSAKPVAVVQQLKPQTTCPVQGDPIDKNLYVDYNGKRIYVCCKGCLAEVTKDPEKQIKKLASMGQSVETIAVKSKTATTAVDDTTKVAAAGYWTCPMHPDVHGKTAGNCSLCGMKLEFKK